MALQSQLMSGDPQLEAALLADRSHIEPGASGPHVAKIQTALILLDGAELLADGIYGSLTANAVLSYKQKRSIINSSYQYIADNIVGKMTVARLDADMLAFEAAQRDTAPVRIKPASPLAKKDMHAPSLALSTSADRNGKSQFVAKPARGAPTFNPGYSIELRNQEAMPIEVTGGVGTVIGSADDSIATIVDPTHSNAQGGQFPVRTDPQLFEVRGRSFGSTVIVAQRKRPLSPIDAAYLRVQVRNPGRTRYDPTDAHHHAPCRKPGCWENICRNPNNWPKTAAALTLDVLSATRPSPRTVIDAAIRAEFADKPVALDHLRHYLKGNGANYSEDRHIDRWVRIDPLAREYISDFLLRNIRNSGVVRGTMFFDQLYYGDQDYRYAFGAIDKLDIEVDFFANSVKLWFMDCYEWHPMYEAYYSHCPNDEVRPTNFVHAASVQLKLEGASDFWMRGEATLPLSLFPRIRPF